MSNKNLSGLGRRMRAALTSTRRRTSSKLWAAVEALESRRYFTAAISGTVFNDANADTIFNSTESGLSGWTVFIDKNFNGSVDPGEPSTTSDATGKFSIGGLVPGTYDLAIVNRTGWRETIPSPQGTEWAVTLGSTNFTGIPFGETQSDQINGLVYQDTNGSGNKDSSEPGLSGWTVFDDVNNNGSLDSGEPSAVTNTSGVYAINAASSGTVNVRAKLPTGWIATGPVASPGVITVTLSPGGTQVGINLGEAQPGSVTGTIFNDTNGNGTQDAGEVALSGWRAYIDTNNDLAYESGEATALSDSTGKYLISGVVPGSRTVRDVPLSGWDTTGSGTYTLIVTSGLAVTGKNFGNRPSTPVTFADPDLAAAVRVALGFTPTQTVFASDMKKLTSLSADSNLISSLSGLQTATNLQSLSLTPGDWSTGTGSLTDLSTLAGLTALNSLTLQRCAVTGAMLAGLGSTLSLQSLDLKYNNIASVTSFAGLAKLKSLSLYGNPTTDLSALAGKSLVLDLAPSGLDKATTPAAIAAALYKLPLAIYQYVLNNIQYQAYAGQMKGAQATLETKKGNDWDQASLLASILSAAGVTAQFVSGRVQIPIATAMSWLGVTTAAAASDVAANAGLNVVNILDGLGNTIALQVDHAWVQATINGAAVAMDPSWKFKDYQTGVANMLGLVPFNETDYLSHTRPELLGEYYANKVAAYLTINKPSVSLADVPYDGPINQQSITAIPTSLPYTVLGTPTTTATVPTTTKHRVELVLSGSPGTLFDVTLNVPDVCLQRITIGFAPASGGLVTPQLLLDGVVKASGPNISFGDSVHLEILHYNAGSSVANSSFGYDRTSDQYIAIGLDANQISDQFLLRLQTTVNTADIAAADGTAVKTDDEIGGLLALAVDKWFHDTDAQETIIDSLTHAAECFQTVGSGLATSGSTATFHAGLQITEIPTGVNVDMGNNTHVSFPIDAIHTNDAVRERMVGDNDSADEHAVWEELVNTTSISTIKSLQLAGDRGIPVFNITAANESTIVPLLTLDFGTIFQIESDVASGATVTVPRDPTPLNSWQGVGYISDFGGGNAAYIISGGLAQSTRLVFSGGSGTGDPNSPNPVQPGTPNDNQQNVGDPINVSNGDVSRDETDFSLPNVGVPLVFHRHYDSESTVDAGMGTGWVFTYGDTVKVNTGGSVTWSSETGAKYTFTPNGSGGYLNPTTLFGKLTAVSGGGFQYRATNGLVRKFNAAGKLISVVDRNGNGEIITLNSSGQISTVADALSATRKLTFTFTLGHITSIADFTGRTWTYAYTGSTLTKASAPTDAATPAAVVKYAYFTDVARSGLLQSVTEPDGGITTFNYYANRRAMSVTNAMGYTQSVVYNQFRNRTTAFDERGNLTSYDFNNNGEVISTLHADGARESATWVNDLVTSRTDVFGKVESYTYDSLGNLTKKVDRLGNITTFTYDSVFSNVLSTTLPGSRVTNFTYDAKGNPIKEVDAVGDITTMTFDSRGELLTITRPKGNLTSTAGDFTTTFTYDSAGDVLTRKTDLPAAESFTYDLRGNILTHTNADGKTTTFVYDLLGRPTKITDPLGGVSTRTYDAAGNLLTKTDPLGRTTKTTYDLRQLPLTRTFADGTMDVTTYDSVGDIVTAQDELGRMTKFSYDNRNRVFATVAPDGTLSRDHYDGEGRITSVVDPLGNVTSFSYDALNRLIKTIDALGGVTTNVFDAVGNLLSVTDPLNRKTQYAYDLLGRAISVTDPLGNVTKTAFDADGNVISVTDPLTHVTTYAYDLADRMVKTTDALGHATTTVYDAAGNVLSITDPDGNKTTYTYDADNREITESNALNVARTYGYDVAGQLTSEVDRDGRKRTFTFNKRGQELTENWLSSTGTITRTESSSYDAAGQQVAATDPDSTYLYTYDVMGRVLSVSNAGTVGAPVVILTFTYDADGNRITSSDSIGGIASGTLAYAYDALNRNTQLTQSGSGVNAKRVNLAYDADSEIASLTRYADTTGTTQVAASTFTYDSDGRLTALKHAKGTTVLALYGWTFDAAGRITKQTLPDGTDTFAYDNTNQLTADTHTYQTNEAYTYDANGNRTSGGTATGTDNRVSADATYTYLYDGEGNLIKRTLKSTGATTEYTWDYRNRLTRVLSKTSAAVVTEDVSYTYDSFNRRIAKSVDADGSGPGVAVITRFVYDGSNIALQFTGTTLTHRYLYAPGSDKVLADDKGTSGGVAWALVDDQGTVRDVIDNTGAVKDHIKYDGFGKVTSESNATAGILFGYTGQVRDAETGMDFYKARYYDPGQGRFIGQDPSGFAARDVNLYRYVRNNTPNRTDPTGRHSEGFNWTPWLIGGGVLLGIGGLILFGPELGLIALGDAALEGLGAEGAGALGEGALGEGAIGEGALGEGAAGEGAAGEGAESGQGLPKNPDDLSGQGYNETSHPDAADAGHRTFENPDTGDKLRFDEGKPGEPGFEGEDHYHRYNPDSTGKGDMYLDKNGNPVPRGSGPSHLFPGE